MMKFIDLQRQFHDVPEDAELEETEHLVLLSQYEFGPSFGWSELLKCKRVILLAEAGSGKTKEMEEQVKRLAQEGQFAFFVALDDLDRERIAHILSPDEEENFNRWKADGQEPAWFFLDALDELKLAKGKLDRGLRRLSGDLNGFLGRARFIISCRPSDWRPIDDLETVRKRLPVPQRSGHILSQPSEAMFIEVLRREFGHTSPAPDGDKDLTDRDTVRIVAMLPMNDTQIRLFAEQSGVSDATAFLAEIDRQNAWTFARRPLDLSDLIVAWTESGRLGTRAQQHEANVAAKLKEMALIDPTAAFSPTPRLSLGQNALRLPWPSPAHGPSDPPNRRQTSDRRKAFLILRTSLPTGPKRNAKRCFDALFTIPPPTGAFASIIARFRSILLPDACVRCAEKACP